MKNADICINDTTVRSFVCIFLCIVHDNLFVDEMMCTLACLSNALLR